MSVGYTYDTAMLVAAERGDRIAWALHKRALERALPLTVPAPVLAQAWRGGPQAQLSRLLRGCTIEEMSAPGARAAGAMCAAAHTSDVVDAAVVVGALHRRDVVVTGDRADLAALASAAGRQLRLRPI